MVRYWLLLLALLAVVQAGVSGCGSSEDPLPAGTAPLPGGGGGSGGGGGGGGATDTTAPRVVATQPPDDAVGVPPTAPITATFSESIDASSVGPNSFVVRDSFGRAITGTVSASDRTAQFLPMPGALAASTAYQATLTTVIADLAGNAPVSDFVWSFTTIVDMWLPTAVTAATPTARFDHTAVWTGNEIIVWGGIDGTGVTRTGGHYAPDTDSWRQTSLNGAPLGRTGHSAAWTGNEMIIWGGVLGGISGVTDTGARYAPNAGGGTWVATPRTNAPLPRWRHTAVWTGREMIVWGGELGGGLGPTNTGGRFNPNGGGSWNATESRGTREVPTPRTGHTAVWTGTEMIVWGGTDNLGVTNSGARYDPSTDAWTRIADAPFVRSEHTAVWTGGEMIVWGGVDPLGNSRTGARYDPAADTWTAIAANGAPSARRNHTAVWTGTEMIVWGGDTANATGGAYSAARDAWRLIATADAPAARTDHTAVWTGREMIVWGGNDGLLLFNTGGRYRP